MPIYREDNMTFGGVTPDEQSRLWAQYGEKYVLNEFRVIYLAGGYSWFHQWLLMSLLEASID